MSSYLSTPNGGFLLSEKEWLCSKQDYNDCRFIDHFTEIVSLYNSKWSVVFLSHSQIYIYLNGLTNLCNCGP